MLLEATVSLPNQKGIILTFASLTVDGLTFMGAMIDNSLGGNGAGIRDQNAAAGATLMVRNSVFTNNQEGILTGDDTGETIAVTNSKFENNGNPDPSYFQHALYVNHAGRLTVTDSLFCGQLIGHDDQEPRAGHQDREQPDLRRGRRCRGRLPRRFEQFCDRHTPRVESR